MSHISQNTDSQVKTISFVMIITLIGKLLGLYRTVLLAVTYGTGMFANAFSTASRIPRVFFDVLFASAIAASFILYTANIRRRKVRKRHRGLPGISSLSSVF